MNNENSDIPDEGFIQHESPIETDAREIFATCSRNGQTAMIVPTIVVEEITLIETFDENRVVIAIPIKTIRRRMSFEQMEQILISCEHLVSDYFDWTT